MWNLPIDYGPPSSCSSLRHNQQSETNKDDHEVFGLLRLDDHLNALSISPTHQNHCLLTNNPSNREIAIHSYAIQKTSRCEVLRAPRRLQERKYQIISSYRPPSSPSSPDDSEDEKSNPSALPQSRASSQAMATPLTQEQISPPSSPELPPWQNPSRLGEVSPVDDDVHWRGENIIQDPPRDGALQQQQASFPGAGQEMTTDGLRAGGAPITQAPLDTNIPRLPQQRRPVPPSQLHISNFSTKPPSSQASRVQGTSPSFGQRVRRLGKPKTESLENRPPWKGASGREPQVKPLQDDLTGAPLTVMPRSGRRIATGSDPLVNSRIAERNSHGREASRASSAMRKLFSPKINSHADSGMYALQKPIDQANAVEPYPSPPPTNSIPPALRSTVAQSELSPSPTFPENAVMSITTKSIKRKPPPAAHVAPISLNSDMQTSTPGSPTNIQGVPHATIPSSADTLNVTSQDVWEQPPSRFSITTIATSHADTSRMSEEEEQTPVAAKSQVSTPIIDRGRYDHFRSVSASPFGQKSPAKSSFTHSPHRQNPKDGRNRAATDVLESSKKPPSILSLSKPLPPAPPEISAADRVEHLNAQLHGLANRRMNINKGIKQMTELMPMDNILASSEVLRKREEEKKKIEGLKSELAEVQREEYELGLKLHRAYKRQDKEGEFEPTTLWVRRVAS